MLCFASNSVALHLLFWIGCIYLIRVPFVRPNCKLIQLFQCALQCILFNCISTCNSRSQYFSFKPCRRHAIENYIFLYIIPQFRSTTLSYVNIEAQKLVPFLPLLLRKFSTCQGFVNRSNYIIHVSSLPTDCEKMCGVYTQAQILSLVSNGRENNIHHRVLGRSR